MNKKYLETSNSINPWEDAIEENERRQNTKKVLEFAKVAKLNKIKNSPEIKISWFVFAILILWILSGFYQVQPSEQGVILRFGKYVDTTDSGLHYHLPYPIENVVKVNVSQERSINIGSGKYYGESTDFMKNYRYIDGDSNLNSFTESHMLTGDENIVDINMTIVWKIKSSKDYLFSMRNPDRTVQVAAQSVLREIVGQSEMQPIITGDRGKVEYETKKELQKVLDDFNSGIQIVRVKLQKADPPKQVIDAFNEVQRAKADMERFKNEAEAYRNEILPKAKGQASQILQNAEAYKESVINKAKGDAERFNYVYNAYKTGKEVTSKRLYLETMEKVLDNSNKIIIDPSAKGSNPLPILPLSAGNNK